MNTKHILIAALLAGAFAPAMAAITEADDPGAAREVKRERIVTRGAAMRDMTPFERAFLAGPMTPIRARGIKNAPYSGELISEQQQLLADGNQIVNKSSVMSYRDSAGRTRQETRDASGNLRSVTIYDAVERVTYFLKPETKTATKIGPRPDMARLAGEKARVHTEELRQEGDEQIIVKRMERHVEGETRRRTAEDVRIRITKDMADGASAGLERIGPVIAGAFGDMKWASKATVKDLGGKEIDGIKAQGKLKSYEIPAGEIGNRNAITVTTESWYSPELQITLLNKRSDPRTGERSWRMAGIKRDEPAAALFTVPSDYTIKDVMAQMRKIEKK